MEIQAVYQYSIFFYEVEYINGDAKTMLKTREEVVEFLETHEVQEKRC